LLRALRDYPSLPRQLCRPLQTQCVCLDRRQSLVSSCEIGRACWGINPFPWRWRANGAQSFHYEISGSRANLAGEGGSGLVCEYLTSFGVKANSLLFSSTNCAMSPMAWRPMMPTSSCRSAAESSGSASASVWVLPTLSVSWARPNVSCASSFGTSLLDGDCTNVSDRLF
jgi:hypothetical protein